MPDHEPLGKYRIHSELGQGGFATVYRAVDTTLDREVALKVLDPLLLRDGAWVARFRQEAKAVANLRHPHIISIYEINETDGRLYIAMELARGGSLSDIITARQRLPWSETLHLFQPICAALDYAHGQGVIHRDLKPANILLDPESGPLLTDFGFARLLSDNSMSMSLSGGVLGTPSYIAPEVWELAQADAPVDIYALGCIIYEMLTGKTLFGGKTPMQAMHAHDLGPRYPATWPQDTPGDLSAVLDKALARDTQERYSKAGALWNALDALNTQAEAAKAQAAKAQAAKIQAAKAQAARERAAQAEAARQAAQERATAAAQHRAAAHAAMQTGQLPTAQVAVSRWLTVVPQDQEALALQKQITERMAQTRRPSAPPDPLAQPYQNLQALLAAKRWAEAERQARAILKQDADYRDVASLARQAAAQARQTRPSAPPIKAPSNTATILGVLGVLLASIGCLGSFLLCPGILVIPAFILGILALGKAENSANPKSARTWGTAAIILACLSVIIVCISAGLNSRIIEEILEEILWELGL